MAASPQPAVDVEINPEVAAAAMAAAAEDNLEAADFRGLGPEMV